MDKQLKNIRYFFEYIVILILFRVVLLMPVERASNFGGFIGRTVGPRLGASRKAMNNLRQAIPGLDEALYRNIIKGMWDNLGRIVTEYPHLSEIARERTEVVNIESLLRYQDNRQPVVSYFGHLGNWELIGPALSACNVRAAGIYRAPNNPWVARLIKSIRTADSNIDILPKSRKGMRELVRYLQNGVSVGIYVDQKYNEGIPVPFFGRLAMTSSAFVELAKRFNAPLLPIFVERLPGTRFRFQVLPPVPLHNEDGTEVSAEEGVRRAHAIMEDWIRERPEQWLWLHKRWDSARLSKYTDQGR